MWTRVLDMYLAPCADGLGRLAILRAVPVYRYSPLTHLLLHGIQNSNRWSSCMTGHDVQITQRE